MVSKMVMALEAAAPETAMAGVMVAVTRTPATVLRPTRPRRPPSTPDVVRFVSGIGLMLSQIPGRSLDRHASWTLPSGRPTTTGAAMTTWEYLTAPLLIHNTAAILNNWCQQDWDLAQGGTGPEGGAVGYYTRTQ